MKGQFEFFDLAERHDKLMQMCVPLVVLKKEVNWKAFRTDLDDIHDQERKSERMPVHRASCAYSSNDSATDLQPIGRADRIPVMHTQTIKNQKHLLHCVLDQRFQKLNQFG